MQQCLSSDFISCNKDDLSKNICNACQLGKHLKLPFSSSASVTHAPFELPHSDLWTSPISSVSCYKYYILFLDDLTHYLWVFPLWAKSEAYGTFVKFHTFVRMQFNLPIKYLQCDNGCEYDNSSFKSFSSTLGIHARLSCPHTSQQNGKA